MPIGDVTTFHRFARFYDLFLPAPDGTSLQAGLEEATRPIERVLDVGGGPGRAVRTLGADVRVVVDPAGGMVQRARGHGLGAVRGDGARLPVASESVDAVLISDALHHIADQQGTLQETRRVLRPGGVLVVRDFDPTTARGRVLVALEHLWGFQSTFTTPAPLCADIAEAGLDARIVEGGFDYTVAGVRRTESETAKGGESE